MEKNISIILPTFNRGYILSKAIDSVIQQTYTDFELIIIDDGSSDNTSEIVRRYHDARIRYIQYYPNKGGNHARNVGIHLAEGEYLAFIDSDNIWDKEYLAKRIEIIDSEKLDLVFGDTYITYENGLKRRFPRCEETDLGDIQGITKKILCNNVIDTNTACVKKTVALDIGGFNEELKRFQDWDFFIRIICGGYTCKYVHDVNELVHGFIQRDSVSNHSEYYWDAKKHIFLSHINEIKNNECLAEALHSLVIYSDKKNHEIISEFEHEFDEELMDEIQKSLSRDNSYKNNQIEALKDAWIEKAEKGNSIEEYLIKKGIHNIVIYGYGRLGKMLHKVVDGTSVNVAGIVDKSFVDSDEANDKLFTPSLEIQTAVDAVINTAIFEHKIIERLFLSKNVGRNIKIISIESLIYGY